MCVHVGVCNECSHRCGAHSCRCVHPHGCERCVCVFTQVCRTHPVSAPGAWCSPRRWLGARRTGRPLPGRPGLRGRPGRSSQARRARRGQHSAPDSVAQTGSRESALCREASIQLETDLPTCLRKHILRKSFISERRRVSIFEASVTGAFTSGPCL